MTNFPACPFAVGDIVRFSPREKTRNLSQNIEGLGIRIGEEAEIKYVLDGLYLSFDDNQNAWPWTEFELVQKAT